MKINSTLVCKVLLPIAFLFLTFNAGYSQCITPEMKYANPILVSGTPRAENAIYKFPSVTPGVDAFITITKIHGGATLTSIDDNRFGYNAAWQPVVRTPSTQGAVESYVSFKIEFKDSANGQAHKYECSQLSYIDVDGDNQHVREFVATKDYDSYTISNASILTLTQISGGLLQATSTRQNFPGLDTTAYITNINFRFKDKDKIEEVRIGTITDANFTVQDRYSCGYFKQIPIPVGGPLPVKYLSFNALVNNSTILLNWQTSMEINHSHFEVERSLDGTSYSTIAIVLDGFSNGNIKTYQAKDNSKELTGKSVVYYRLKQIDIDGKVNYSTSLAVRLDTKKGIEMEVSPNPFTEKIYVRFNSKEKGNAEIRIVNIGGITLQSRQSPINVGYNNLQIDGLASLPAGIYIARLILNGVVINNQKIIKQ